MLSVLFINAIYQPISKNVHAMYLHAFSVCLFVYATLKRGGHLEHGNRLQTQYLNTKGEREQEYSGGRSIGEACRERGVAAVEKWKDEAAD